MHKYLIAIPFYKNEHFIENFISWYSSEDSLVDKNLISKVLIYNDFPLSENSLYLSKKCDEIGFDYIQNAENIGYLKTVNLAYAYARESNSNLILLNSDTIPVPGFLSEIDQCFSLDSMLAVLSVRSNNATICNLYDSPIFFDGDVSLEKFKKDHQRFTKYVPRISYTPTVTGFCFAIKINVIKIFDGFDELFTVGYEEENDYCLRVSERGFRVGIANKAFVAHIEGQSFGLTSNRSEVKNGNAILIRVKHPYYDLLIDNYSQSTNKLAESKVSKCLSNETKFLIDARVLSSCHNGSNKFIVSFLKGLSSLGYKADVIAYKDAILYHNLTQLKGVNFVQEISKVYEFGFLLGQPMHHSALWLVPQHSLVSTCVFFDTIAHDCPQLRCENAELDSIWTQMPYIFSDISFISDHSKTQFQLKFGRGVANLNSHLLPVIIDSPENASCEFTDSVLVFGNKFLHKGVDILLNELPAKSGLTYYVLGSKSNHERTDVIYLAPGEVEGQRLHQLIKSVNYILLPSFAEGYGFPLLEALSYGKSIYCRDIECFREIISVLSEDQRMLINFVPNFKDIESQSGVSKLNISSANINKFTSYEGYIVKLLDDVKKSSANLIFSHMKMQINISKLNNISNNFAFVKPKIIFRAARKIYRILLTTRFHNQARGLKDFLFKFDLITTILR